MAFNLSNLGPFQKIVEDFKQSLNNIFGPPGSNTNNEKLQLFSDVEKFFKDRYGSEAHNPTLWTGNTNRKGAEKLRYGFRIVSIAQINRNFSGPDKEVYYLDIPPQNISQREIFSTDIQATRRGVVVQSEGVVFKDIVIAGTTGVFPGARNDFGGEQANFSNLTSPPKRAQGVTDQGVGKDKIITGYSEFILLRQYFLYYASEKVRTKGDRFLVFINEKDQQALIVEPLEFTMDRSSKSPMQYQYKIVMRAIGTYEGLVQTATADETPDESLVGKIANVARNASAAINQFRAAVGATNRLVQGISQEIDSTFIRPLRLLGTALNDLADARANILAVPTVLMRNLNESLLAIQENRFINSREDLVNLVPIPTAATSAILSTVSNPVEAGRIALRGATDNPTSAILLAQSKSQSFIDAAITDLENSAITPIPRSFVQNLRTQTQDLADKVADSLNIGNEFYNEIKNRTQVNQANPLRTYTNNEFILLGNLHRVVDSLNQVLATNEFFESAAEDAFENKVNLFDGKIALNVPQTVREVTIQRGETLERIALREYGSAARWVDLAVLNNLKYPYIADVRQDGVKQYGDKLLVGNE